ncbi:terminase gpP N-terminus-related DNA-binding protein [Anaerorhabdus sp.]|uniref:terminase gpP N-terminus-related DNA-binding protein n=1 Tax=Anaerorhabdus sp. TaxID=1872524 RepID=UPI003FA5C2AC
MKERWRYDLKKDNKEIEIIARELFKNGMKYKDIASQVGVTESCIKSWATRYWKKEKLQLNQNMEEGKTLIVGMVQDLLKIKMQ